MSPKVHVMSEPEFGILVTGTHDVDEAKRLADDEVVGYVASDDADEVAAWFAQHPGQQQVGRIIPAHEDYVTWWWRTGYELGKPGVTRAVVFQ